MVADPPLAIALSEILLTCLSFCLGFQAPGKMPKWSARRRQQAQADASASILACAFWLAGYWPQAEPGMWPTSETPASAGLQAAPRRLHRKLCGCEPELGIRRRNGQGKHRLSQKSSSVVVRLRRSVVPFLRPRRAVVVVTVHL